MTHKKAFTLIELLVVIAIIAILAAILFPVFAQAKMAAKKTQALSNHKQMGTSAAIYTADYDDTFPGVWAIAQNNACDGNIAAGTPLHNLASPASNWAVTTPLGADCGAAQDANSWVSSVQPYIKSYELTKNPTGAQYDVYSAPTFALFTKAPAVSSTMMNGHLNYYSTTAVAEISKNPLFVPQMGGHNWRGGNAMPGQPTLRCNGGTGLCKFNPTGAPQAGSTASATVNGDGVFLWVNLKNTWKLYGENFTYVRGDTSAKVSRVAAGTTYNAPFTYTAAGEFGGSMRCRSSATSPAYQAWFRPDSTYSYPFGVNTTCGF